MGVDLCMKTGISRGGHKAPMSNDPNFEVKTSSPDSWGHAPQSFKPLGSEVAGTLVLHSTQAMLRPLNSVVWNFLCSWPRRVERRRKDVIMVQNQLLGYGTNPTIIPMSKVLNNKNPELFSPLLASLPFHLCCSIPHTQPCRTSRRK